MGESLERIGIVRPLATAADALFAVIAATVAVALLDSVAPITGLGVLYLLAVLFVAIRRGEVPALATAALSVLTLNYFFIAPRHRLTIADSENVVALAVFLIAAFVVGRLAGAARERAAEAESRAQVAAAREREAAILAAVGSSVLAGGGIERELAELGGPGSGVRVELAGAPAPLPGEQTVRLPTRLRSAWLHVADSAGWDREDVRRFAEPLARLIDVAFERERVAEQAADAEAARRADVAKTAVLHAISHDLRSPLTGITTAVAGLRVRDLDPTDRAELVSVIEAESERLARLVDDLLDLSRIQAGATNPQVDWCDLADVVGSAAVQVRALRPNAAIAVELPPDLPLVRADQPQLERVFANLIDNAVKFSPPGEPVRIGATTAAGRVTVRVRDFGRGIPQGQRRQVFEPFYRGRRAEAGAGLGLAICRGFVEANDGTISIQDHDGEGTSFVVSFPLVPQPAPA